MFYPMNGRPSARKSSLCPNLRLILWLSVLAIGLVSHTAQAQGNSTLAEALFDDGRKEFDAGNFDEACAKFKESQRLDPATGTLLNLAICYEKAGRLATAWTTWREAASSARAAGQPDREQHARDMAAKLKGMLARLTIRVADYDTLPKGFTLTQDGVVQPAAAWGISLPVDAGEHHFEASAPGYLSWTSELTVKDGETATLEVPPLKKDPDAAAAVASAPEDRPKSSAEKKTNTNVDEDEDEDEDDEEVVDPGRSKRRLKVWGISLTAAGGASLGIGTIFGIQALNKNAASKDGCSPADPNICSSAGKKDRDDALVAANLSNLFIVAGAAAVTTGVVFLVISSRKSETALHLSPTPGGGHVSLSGAF